MVGEINHNFSSINQMQGLKTSRKDDIESMVYLCSAMIKGLQWSKWVNGVKKDLKEVLMMKLWYVKQINPYLPKEFQIILNHARSLEFEGKPDYDSLRGLLNGVKNKLVDPRPYWDW